MINNINNPPENSKRKPFVDYSINSISPKFNLIVANFDLKNPEGKAHRIKTLMFQFLQEELNLQDITKMATVIIQTLNEASKPHNELVLILNTSSAIVAEDILAHSKLNTLFSEMPKKLLFIGNNPSTEKVFARLFDINDEDAGRQSGVILANSPNHSKALSTLIHEYENFEGVEILQDFATAISGHDMSGIVEF